ncbi:MAG: arginine--tRNA ligase [Candidatus Riflebacteria bacterium]|nr:arginine--tRNA ligase [Candidatus Riflebacteria bacterium]
MRNHLSHLLKPIIEAICGELGVSFVPGMLDLQRPPDPNLGDFALNTAMRLAKPAKKSPLVVANLIAEKLAPLNESTRKTCKTDAPLSHLDGFAVPDIPTPVFKKIEVVAPGFVNLFVSECEIENQLVKTLSDPVAALCREGRPDTVVVDYSSVNIAKQMHVGHLRTTIIGDVIVRVLEARGDKVIRQNHLGDWGLPIAMVLMHAQPIMRELEASGKDLVKELPLERLEEIYREATRICAADSAAAAEAHRILVELQNGNAGLLADWRTITRLAMVEVYRIYNMLDVTLTPEHERGESFYRDMLADTVSAIDKTGKLVTSDGAGCVFLEQFRTKEGNPLPVIIQKADGGYNYATFDMAAIRFRIETLRANRLIYVTDARQALHFAQVFALADSIGWTRRDDAVSINCEKVSLEHVPFGSVLGEDNKPLKTRTGENVKLSELLQESIDRAFAVVNEKNGALPEDQKRAIAHDVGIGAIKYADLSQNRNNDYVFSFDRMLALNGNTAPYLQYAHARICSIFRKGGISEESINARPMLVHPAERALGLKLLQFPESVTMVAVELRPHILCNYLYELSAAFSSFYDGCPVLVATSEDEKQSRLALCRLTRDTLARGLDLLGIRTPREM